ncbi:hypothetical protein DFH09DRAFT_32752 [Mycena vulgaris]|nr:hypothetical protein DFH09DRAFT_32752 [Mycena vulgaris]
MTISSVTRDRLNSSPTELNHHRPFMFPISPPAEALPPPAFDTVVLRDGARETSPAAFEKSPGGLWDSRGSEDAVLPILPSQRIKVFNATVVFSDSDNLPHSISKSQSGNQCPPWSEWATAQFTFDYLLTLLTSSTNPEVFMRRYNEQYMDAVFKLSVIIASIGKMADDSPPPSFFQSFYYLRRLFPNGLIAAEDFTGEAGTALLVRAFALGIAVANQAIYEQRNLNLDWQGMCGIPDYYVDALEMTALDALNGDVFDLSQNRTVYLDWLGHLGYHAEFHHFRTAQTYRRSSADLIAFAHAQAFSLPRECRRNDVQPIHLPRLEQLSLLLCWDTGVTPLRPKTIQFNHQSHRRPPKRSLRPTAADVLAALAEECTSRLLFPICM